CVNCVQSAACTMCFFYNKKTFKIIGECILMFAVNKKERKKERKFSYTVKNCFARFPSPAGMSLTKLSQNGN
ncbi:MAG: hypothetical protein ACK55Z_11325, partial [bacterium]